MAEYNKLSVPSISFYMEEFSLWDCIFTKISIETDSLVFKKLHTSIIINDIL